MKASGTFDINLDPQNDAFAPVGRIIIDKTYLGDLSGSGIGQMISKRTPDGHAAYAAIEEFNGELNGKSGGFTLLHQGLMSADSQQLHIQIIEGSGHGDLVGISGTLDIIQSEQSHSYQLHFELSED
ncbi:DUF3224 domain-containing protein [Thalassotalea mangrovi]|uniref:DUF3224 domain-containing protein n=1 Tax=Thalassotalea mangrovi TaxID=2572245 RepID=A0A4U1B1Z1_9GAMM|nr:DUF3224 domain-containing protein [Thalassotalea mangrovi]TKB43290.1 DUF3224 domain-containing protein [Thalassotalea mangrovi]